MKKGKRRMRGIAWLLVFALMGGSMGQPVGVFAAKKPKLNKKRATIRVGKTVKLKVKNAKGKVKWSSSNKKVASVNKKGLVKGKKKGTAKITAKVRGRKLKCKIVVKPKKKANVPQETGETEAPQASSTTSPSPTKTPEITATPQVTETPQPTETPVETPTEEPTKEPAPTPEQTETPAPTPTQSEEPVPTPEETEWPALTIPPLPTEGVTEEPEITPVPTYQVDISVCLDGSEWKEHGKNLRLRKGEEAVFCEGFQVTDGTYAVYDGDEDTGSRVTVNGSDTSVTLNYYTVTFMDSSTEKFASIEPQILLEGEHVKRPEEPGKNDYKFTGWFTEPEGTSAFDFNSEIRKKTDIYAGWEADPTMGTYQVTYYYEKLTAGEYDEVKGSIQGAIKGSIVTVPLRAVEGFTVTDNPNGETTWTVTIPNNGDLGKVSIYYKRNSYTLTWELNGGSVDGSTAAIQQEKRFGEAITAPECEPAAGYEFVSWNQIVLSKMPAQNKTYVAQYREKTSPLPGESSGPVASAPAPTEGARYAVTVSLKKDDASWTDSGKDIRLKKSGESFYYDATKTNSLPNGTYSIYDGDEDTGCTVTVNGANAEAVLEYYTVSFLDGTSVIPALGSQILRKGERVQRPSLNPGKAGYSFRSWVTEQNGTVAFDFSQKLEKKTDIYAAWTEDSNMGSYRVVYCYENADDDEFTKEAGLEQGALVGSKVSVPVPEKAGFVPQEGQQATTVTIQAGQTTEVEIYYKRNRHTLTWKLNGGSVNGDTKDLVQTVKYGATVEAPECEPAAGYEFTGWDQSVVSSMPDRNVTYIAQYKKLPVVTPTGAPETTPEPENPTDTPETTPGSENPTDTPQATTNPVTPTEPPELTPDPDSPTDTPKPTQAPTATVRPTATPLRTRQPSAAPTKKPTATPIITLTPTVRPMPTAIPTATPEPKYQVTVTIKATDVGSEETAEKWVTEYTKTIRLLNETTKAYYDAAKEDGTFTVPEGTYTIYSADKPIMSGSAAKTIKVAGADAQAELQYYSVRFYDRTTEIATIPIQWILAGEKPKKPEDPGKKGSEFKGWYTDGEFGTAYDFETAITAPTNIYAKFEENSSINTYQLKYEVENLDGTFTPEDGPVLSGTKNEKVTVTAPEREGFTPDAKTKEVTISSDENKTETVTFKYTRNTYTLTWKLGVGSQYYADEKTDQKVEKLKYGAAITPPNTSPAAGYRFVQWDQPTPDKVMPAHDLTYTAEYEIIKYTIYWEETAGVGTSEVMPTTYDVTTEITLPTANQMERKGYTFLGWEQGSLEISTKLPTNAAGYVTSIPTGTTGDLQLIAKWEIRKYKITWDDAGADYCTDWLVAEYTVEESVILPTKETIGKAGYTFAGWKNGAGELLTSASIPKGTTGNLSLTAQWSKDTYKITWNDNNGKYTGAERATTYQVDTATITLPTADQMTWKGHTFMGWTDNENYKITEIAKGSVGDITLTANWDSVRYKITWDNDGGTNTVTQPDIYTVEEEIILPTASQMVKEGYTFSGWTQTGVSGYVTKIEKGTTGNIALKANWSLVHYTITWDYNGGKYTGSGDCPTTYTITSEDIVLPTASEMKKDGYDFVRWDAVGYTGLKVISKGSTGNFTLKAQWRSGQSSYTVNHYQENLDQSSKTGVLHDGKYYTLKESVKETGITDYTGQVAPTKSYDGFTSPAKQTVTVTADGKASVDYFYTRNSYTVTWNGSSANAMIDGHQESYAQTVRYEATYTPPKSVTLTGKEFTGWKCTSGGENIAAGSTAGIKMPAGSVVYQAQWKDAVITEDTFVVNSIDAILKTADGDKNMGRSHTLKKVDGTTVNMKSVPKGTYQIWYGDENTGETITVDKNIDKYEIYYCEVRFFKKDTKEVLATQQVKKGGLATKPEAPAGQTYGPYNKVGVNGDFDFTKPITDYVDIEVYVQDAEKIECQVTLDMNPPSDANVKIDLDNGVDGWTEDYGYWNKTYTSKFDIINVPDPYDDNDLYEFVGWEETNYSLGSWDHLNLKVADIWDDLQEQGGFDPCFTAQWEKVSDTPIELSAKSLVVGQQKVTIGQAASDLGTPVRKDTAPQGCEAYIYNNRGNYKQYYVVYVSGGKVVGFATMSSRFRFSSDGTDEIKYGGSIPSGFDTMKDYDYSNAYYAEKNGMHIALYEDDRSGIYAIQVFDTAFKSGKDDVFKCESIAANSGYTTAALTSSAKEMEDWANAYRVNAGLAPFDDKEGVTSAQIASDVLAGKATLPSGDELIDKYGDQYGDISVMQAASSERSPDALGCFAWMLDTKNGANRTKTKGYLLAVRGSDWGDDIYYMDGGYSYGGSMTYGVLHFAHY